jgi:hypothetical protein
LRDHEEPLAPMRRTNVGSSQREPDRIIPAGGKVTEDDVEPASNESCDVLHEHEARSKYANDPRVLSP